MMRQAASVRPTGPTPEEPWCDPEEEQYVPLIEEAFDAYLDGKIVKHFGKEEDGFKFNKCMARNGQPLGPPVKLDQ